jgi:hypothetical protein
MLAAWACHLPHHWPCAGDVSRSLCTQVHVASDRELSQAVSSKTTYYTALIAPDIDGNSNLPCLVIEDDVWLVDDFPAKVGLCGTRHHGTMACTAAASPHLPITSSSPGHQAAACAACAACVSIYRVLMSSWQCMPPVDHRISQCCPAALTQLQQVVNSARVQLPGQDYFASLYLADYDNTVEPLKVRDIHQGKYNETLYEALKARLKAWYEQHGAATKANASEVPAKPTFQDVEQTMRQQQQQHTYQAMRKGYVWGTCQ